MRDLGLTERKINKKSGLLLVTHGFSSIVWIFAKVFLAVYFLKVTQGNLGAVAVFYMIYYLVSGIFFIVLGNSVKAGNKMIVFRSGILLYFIFFLSIVLLKQNVPQYIYALACLYGAANAFYWLPYRVITFELNSFNDRSLYFSVENAIEETLGIIIPVTAGAIINFSSYQPIYIIILIFVSLSFLFSFNISLSQSISSKVDIKGFFYLLRKNNESNVFKAYASEFLRGINYAGAMKIVISLMIFLAFASEFKLGFLSSVFSAITVMTAFAVGKLLITERFKPAVVISGTGLFFAAMLLVFDVSKPSVVIYNLIFSLTIPILTIIQTVFSYNAIEKEELRGFRVEHFIVRDIVLDAGRILGFFLLYMVSIFGSNIYNIRIILIIFSITVLMISGVALKVKIKGNDGGLK